MQACTIRQVAMRPVPNDDERKVCHIHAGTWRPLLMQMESRRSHQQQYPFLLTSVVSRFYVQHMITPTFKVDQDNDSVTICINTPYVRVRNPCSALIKLRSSYTIDMPIPIGSRR